MSSKSKKQEVVNKLLDDVLDDDQDHLDAPDTEDAGELSATSEKTDDDCEGRNSSELSAPSDELSKYFESTDKKYPTGIRKSTRIKTCSVYYSPTLDPQSFVPESTENIQRTPVKQRLRKRPLATKIVENTDESADEEENGKLRRSKVVRTYSPEDTEDDDFEVEKPAAKLRRSKKIKAFPPEDEELTEFEMERRRNIAERMELFKDLGIDGIKYQLEKKRPAKKPKQKVKPKESLPIFDKSERLRTKSFETSAVTAAAATTTLNSVSYNRLLKPLLNMAEYLCSHQYEETESSKNSVVVKVLEDIDSQVKMETDCDLQTCQSEQFATRVSKLATNHDLKAVKIFKSHISSIDFNCSNSGLIMSAGSRTGHVAMWNFIPDTQSDDDISKTYVVFQPHHNHVSCVLFSRFNPHILYSTSYDGTCRKGDLNKYHFQLVHSSNESTSERLALNWLSELSPAVLVIAQQTGEVTVTDKREAPDKFNLSFLHAGPVRTVSTSGDTCLATCADDGVISLFDLRKFRKQLPRPTYSIKVNSSMPSSAFLSHSGRRLLTTIGSEQISVYETLQMEEPLMSWETRRCYQRSVPVYGKSMAVPYKAMWHPGRENHFCVANLNTGVDIFESKITGEPLNTQRTAINLESTHCSLATFHPNLPAIVASSGSYLQLFT